MKKYAEVFRVSFKMQIVWRFDVVMTMAAAAARAIAGWIVWRVIFLGKESVGGFTQDAMLTYYLISSILRSIDFSHHISGEVSYLIRSGRFSGHMVTPVNPLGFFSFMSAGMSAFHLLFSVTAAALCAFAMGINLSFTRDIARILPAAVMIPLGLTFTASFQYLIGVATFKFLEIGFFMYVQWSIIAFVTGSMVPLSLLPSAVLAVLRFIPFTHVIYTPAMLLTGQASAREGLFGLAVLAAWTLMMMPAAHYTYNRLRKKYDGVGI
ncbi:MAG: ABC-2 family transporter protein [Clostridia bacterium]|nr:ABC-2 family transporter protein [Clostridia bacterium]